MPERTLTLFFTQRKQVAGEEVWQFLDRVAEKKTDLDYSGYLLVDYLFVYLEASDDYFQHLDEYYLALAPSGAEGLAAFLATRTLDLSAIERYLKGDGRLLAESERDGILAAYGRAHSDLLEWCASIRPGVFGVLHLSF